MSPLDIIILLVALLAIIYGLVKGIITQIGSLVGIIVGILLCRLFGQQCTALLAGAEPSETALYVCSIVVNIVLFVVGFVITKLIAKVLKTVAHAIMLSLIDRIAGAIFSLFAWMLVLSLVLNVWQAFSTDRSIASYSKLANGKVAETVLNMAPAVLGSPAAISLLDSLENESS